ncbi:MAG: dihydroorotate dehydrogenase electron transfer subunit [Nitrospiraceae bacterium]|nr:dihydroorotate dehydrogenase electron transfer subunit [Nitrospiraceae bacterium]
MPSVVDCPIVLRQEVAEGHYRISVQAPGIARVAKPGQFAMLQVSGGYAPFLRRPMSIERIFSDGVSFLFKVEGEGTRLLAEMDTGHNLSVHGPLGNGFTIDTVCDRHILVAGGIGVAPLPALAERVKRDCGKAPDVIIAARTERLLLCEDDFRRMGCAIHITTDDGSAGEKALATGMLERLAPDARTCVYACGPNPMLRAVSQMMLDAGVMCLVSLEAQMACGDGACLGCVIESKSEIEGEKMLRVCKDGPVFDASLIDWAAHDLRDDQ